MVETGVGYEKDMVTDEQVWWVTEGWERDGVCLRQGQGMRKTG